MLPRINMKLKLFTALLSICFLSGCGFSEDKEHTINYDSKSYCNDMVDSAKIIFNNKDIGVTKEQNFKVIENGKKTFYAVNRGEDIVPPPVSQLKIISILVFESNDSKDVVANKVKNICSYSGWTHDTYDYYGHEVKINFN